MRRRWWMAFWLGLVFVLSGCQPVPQGFWEQLPATLQAAYTTLVAPAGEALPLMTATQAQPTPFQPLPPTSAPTQGGGTPGRSTPTRPASFTPVGAMPLFTPSLSLTATPSFPPVSPLPTLALPSPTWTPMPVTPMWTPSPVFPTATMPPTATPGPPTATPSPLPPTPTWTASPTLVPSLTWTPSPTNAPPTLPPSPTPAPPTATSSPVPTATPLPSPTWTATATFTSPPPTPTPTWTFTPTPAGCQATGNATFEAQVVALINQERQNVGLPALQVHPALQTAARDHSEDMACNNFFSHIGSDGSTPAERAMRAGYPSPYVAENLYMGHISITTPQTVVQLWMDSPGHRANILNNESVHIGVGFMYDPVTGNAYVTAKFGKP